MNEKRAIELADEAGLSVSYTKVDRLGNKEFTVGKIRVSKPVQSRYWFFDNDRRAMRLSHAILLAITEQEKQS